MRKTIDTIISEHENAEIANAEIIIERTAPEFMETANALGDYLATLPLSNEQHNQLVELIVKQVNAGEVNAYRQGFGLGVKLGRDNR